MQGSAAQRKRDNMNLASNLERFAPDIDEVNQWAESEYNRYFAPYFQGEVELYNRIKSSSSPVTDSELEWILTDLPLELLVVTEQLSKLRTSQEVIKLDIKKKEREYIKSAEGSESKRKEEAAAQVAEDKLLVTVYDSIAERVSRQMTFSKELIMSAKKIWDARRADGAGMLPETVTGKEAELPEYDMSKVGGGKKNVIYGHTNKEI